MTYTKHQWPSFDSKPTVIVDNLSDAQRLPAWAAELPIVVNAHTPGNKAAKALLDVEPILAAYDDALLDALHYGAGFIRVDADGVHHISYAEVKNNAKDA